MASIFILLCFLLPFMLIFVFGMVGATDNRTEPMRGVLIDGTRPEYVAGNGASGQSILPGLIVYKSGTGPNNEVTVCGANYGKIWEEDAHIYIVEIPRSHPSFNQSYAKGTAFTAETDGFRMHRIVVNDRMWLKGSSITVDQNDTVCTATGGLVAKRATTTIDAWNIHTWRVIGEWSSATWIQGEYVGRLSQDEA